MGKCETLFMFFLLKIFLYSLIYLFMTVLSLRCCASFSVVLVSRSYSLVAALVAIWELLIVVASLVRCRVRRLSSYGSQVYSTDSLVVAHRLSCSGGCGILPDRDGTYASCIGRWILYH